MNVIIKAAITIDGKIARSHNELVNWSSREDKKNFVEKTKEAQVLVMGNTTYKTFNKPLKGRLNIVMTREIKKYTSEYDNLIYSNETPEDLIARFLKEGYETIYIIGGNSIYTQFINAKLVTSLDLTVEPVLFGEGISFVNAITVPIKLTLACEQKLNESTRNIIYYVEYI